MVQQRLDQQTYPQTAGLVLMEQNTVVHLHNYFIDKLGLTIPLLCYVNLSRAEQGIFSGQWEESNIIAGFEARLFSG